MTHVLLLHVFFFCFSLSLFVNCSTIMDSLSLLIINNNKFLPHTIYQEVLTLFYTISYYIKWVKTSWTYIMNVFDKDNSVWYTQVSCLLEKIEIPYCSITLVQLERLFTHQTHSLWGKITPQKREIKSFSSGPRVKIFCNYT